LDQFLTKLAAELGTFQVFCFWMSRTANSDYITSAMIETRSKKNPIVGYMGYVASNEGEEQQ